MINCLLCHSNKTALYLDQTENIPWALYGYEKESFPKSLKFYQCSNCDLIFKDPAVRAKLENEKQHYLKHNNDEDNIEYQNYMMRLIEPFLSYLKKGDEGLDFGSGPHPVMEQMFKKIGFTCFSSDPFFNFKESVLDRQYDFITCSEAAEHFCDAFQEFNLLFSLLKQDGKMAIRTKFAPSKDFNDWWYQRDPTHVVFYSEKSFHFLADKYSKRIIFLPNDISIFCN